MSIVLNRNGFEVDGFQELCNFVSYANFNGTPHIPTAAMERLHRILVQSQGGQICRPRVMFHIFHILTGRNATEEEARDIYALGWVVELFQFAILSSDDLADKDQWRRGRWSWHLQPGVGGGAVFDSQVGSCLALLYLKHHFKEHPHYVDMVETVNYEMFLTQLLQAFENMVAEHGPGNLATFNQPKLEEIALGISGYFFLPFGLVLHYLKVSSPLAIKKSREVTNQMAVYYQAQNDFIDSYGETDWVGTAGKGGRDIRENKCAWPIVEALKRCNDEQRAVLHANYGHNDHEKSAEVKRVFDEVDIPGAWKTFQEKQTSHIKGMIDSIDESDPGLKKDMFHRYMEILTLI